MHISSAGEKKKEKKKKISLCAAARRRQVDEEKLRPVNDSITTASRACINYPLIAAGDGARVGVCRRGANGPLMREADKETN